MRLPIALALAVLAVPAAAQVTGHAKPKSLPTPQPTKVVVRSDRLVTARTKGGGTQSFNCRKPENARKAVCRGH